MRKRINYKNIFGIGLAVPAFSLAAVGNAHAQGVDAPSCEALGYDLTEADCAGRLFLKCPFDQTKYFCPDETTSTDCNIGDILYSDKSCSSEVISGKTPIAVVFHAEKRLAIGLETQPRYWSTERFDVPSLTNYSSDTEAKEDWAGKSNTAKVVGYCKSNNKSCPAFEYVKNYSTIGTQMDNWYLPAAGELNVIYTNKAMLNSSLIKAKGQTLPDNWHWSSSEYNNNDAWIQSFYYGYFSSYGRDDSNGYVRPVLEF